MNRELEDAVRAWIASARLQGVGLQAVLGAPPGAAKRIAADAGAALSSASAMLHPTAIPTLLITARS